MDTNVIYCGDCRDILKKIPDESVDLVYLDPPFFSQKHYENFWVEGKGDHETKMGFSDKDWEKLRHSIDPNILKEYEHIEARWKGGHKGIYVYIAYMRERLIQCERVLKKFGSIFLHCDWHASHYLKIMMDDIFGYKHFKSEIIWLRKTSSASKKSLANSHDVIFYYNKDDNSVFNQQYGEYSEEYIKNQYTHKDDKGVYRVHDVVANPALGGDSPRYTYKGYTPATRWLISQDKLERLDQEGKLLWSKTGKPYRKLYLHEMQGQPLGDVWTDIPISSGKENLGYPTQKPEALLDRIIKMASNPTDIILDPFCGCGTTLVVAKKSGRQFIGIDISRIACNVMKKRLGGNARVIGGESPEELSVMDPHEFAHLIIVEKMGGIISPKKSGDMGIDGWVDFKTIPVQVKRWEHSVGRPEIDKFKTAVERDKKTNGIIVAKDFSKDCYAEVARIEKEDKISIELKMISDIMKDDSKADSEYIPRSESFAVAERKEKYKK